MFVASTAAQRGVRESPLWINWVLVPPATPWIVLGDLNIILDESEKASGRWYPQFQLKILEGVGEDKSYWFRFYWRKVHVVEQTARECQMLGLFHIIFGGNWWLINKLMRNFYSLN